MLDQYSLRESLLFFQSRLNGLSILLPDLLAVDDSHHSCSNAQDDEDGYKADFSFSIIFHR